MENQKKSKLHFKAKRNLFYGIGFVFVLMVGVFIYFLIDPALFVSNADDTEEPIYVDKPDSKEEEYNKVTNGIHVRTGLMAADGFMTVVNNCTNCHSAKLIVQNRMNEERWKATIKWMQETQNLWELGDNEHIIVDYLVTNYPPQQKGRRQNLENLEWYALE